MRGGRQVSLPGLVVTHALSISYQRRQTLTTHTQAREDPMSAYVGRRILKQEEKEARRAQLQAMVDQIRAERKEKRRRRKEKKKRRKKVGSLLGCAGDGWMDGFNMGA